MCISFSVCIVLVWLLVLMVIMLSVLWVMFIGVCRFVSGCVLFSVGRLLCSSFYMMVMIMMSSIINSYSICVS